MVPSSTGTMGQVIYWSGPWNKYTLCMFTLLAYSVKQMTVRAAKIQFNHVKPSLKPTILFCGSIKYNYFAQVWHIVHWRQDHTQRPNYWPIICPVIFSVTHVKRLRVIVCILYRTPSDIIYLWTRYFLKFHELEKIQAKSVFQLNCIMSSIRYIVAGYRCHTVPFVLNSSFFVKDLYWVIYFLLLCVYCRFSVLMLLMWWHKGCLSAKSVPTIPKSLIFGIRLDWSNSGKVDLSNSSWKYRVGQKTASLIIFAITLSTAGQFS